MREAFLNSLSPTGLEGLKYDWEFWARPSQREPEGRWRVWLIKSGRGFGKTQIGAECVRRRAEAMPGGRFGLIGQTAADARDVMVEGEAGLLAVSPSWFKPNYEPSKRRLTWPNGAVASTYSGDEPDQLRGPAHHFVWADEPAKWKYAKETWDNMEMGLRLGDNPQVVATTTPRPIPLIKELVADPKTVVTSGSTYENLANLPDEFVQRLLARYEGSRLGRQELHGQILDDNPAALWNRAMLDDLRVDRDTGSDAGRRRR